MTLFNISQRLARAFTHNAGVGGSSPLIAVRGHRVG